VDKRNDYAKFAKLAGSFRQLKADNAAAEGSRVGEVGALQSKIMILEGEISATVDRIKAAEAIEKEQGEKQRAHHAELKSFKNEIESLNSRHRMSEADLAKVTDKLKKREVEVVRLRETMEKMSMQLQKNVEDKDAALMSVVDAQQRAKSHLEKLEGCQEELRKREAEVRVLKRNQSLSLPEELKKLGERLRLMDLERRRAIVEREEKEGEVSELKKELSAAEEEIVGVKIDRGALQRKCSEIEAELNSMKHTNEGERKLLQMEKLRLSDKNNYFRVKLQGEEEHRMRSHFDGRAQENDLIAMRKRNMELLSQLHLTDEARLRAENAAREVRRRFHTKIWSLL
jgi:chromosome segregation ATPase